MNKLLVGLKFFPYGYLLAEFGYEFIRGSRLSPQDQLSLCEQNLTFVAQ
jgi:hypothetical protein